MVTAQRIRIGILATGVLAATAAVAQPLQLQPPRPPASVGAPATVQPAPPPASQAAPAAAAPREVTQAPRPVPLPVPRPAGLGGPAVAPAVEARSAPVPTPTPAAPPPAAPLVQTAAVDTSPESVLRRVNASLNSLSTMQAEFVQTGSNGRRVEGKLYLQKPGRLRFEYKPPAQLEIVADGSSVVIRDRKLGTQDLYALARPR